MAGRNASVPERSGSVRARTVRLRKGPDRLELLQWRSRKGQGRAGNLCAAVGRAAHHGGGLYSRWNAWRRVPGNLIVFPEGLC